MLRTFILSALLGIASISYAQSSDRIIPLPAKSKYSNGSFVLAKNTAVYFDERDSALLLAVSPLSITLEKFGVKLSKSIATAKASIHIELDNSIAAEEGYRLVILPGKISIKAKTATGIFYGVQSLLQLLPLQAKATTLKLPCVTIEDEPRFAYRGVMLDVARHYMSIEFLKKLLNLLAMQKMNRFHLHLTDSQGWRFESKKYPKLTQIGAYRKGTPLNTTYDYNSRPGDTLYGSFYTQQQLRDLVKYAADRFITIIPEIEMPAHSKSALASYPGLACVDSSGNPFPYPQQVQDEYCTKDETFNFLNNILDEVMDIFPSQYIHVAGDEAGKANWKTCPHDIKRMKEQGLANVEELQSYFIKRIEQHVNSRGRSIIGWDEILQGGLAPNATVMSWTGIEGGIKAAQQHHNVIMTPGGYCYLDHYQSNAPGEPVAFGGLTTLAKTYSYNPIPEELTASEAKYILGTQGNLWTEYIPTPAKAEYMIFPRAIALAEVGWSPQETRTYESFITRLIPYLKRLDKLKVNYSKHLFEIKLKTAINTKGQVTASLGGVPKGYKMYYTLDGTIPTVKSSLYVKPVAIHKNSTMIAAVISNGIIVDQLKKNFVLHKATAKSIELETPPAKQYSKGGNAACINGSLGNDENFSDDDWLGWNGKTFNGTIDLGKAQQVSSLQTRFFHQPSSWVWAAKNVTVLVSADGKNFTEVAGKSMDVPANEGAAKFSLNWPAVAARYIKVIAEPVGKIAAGNVGAGDEAWLFVDELIVD
ncbi:glycoside hydrolase family 20 protein [Foetidibacter luteolus]|uniref:glycoside hydrolase family 20 protein n=1 Tax=Foetidibacter luteolus TaxID=2608880 RepID=UPI001A989E45|nr:family 20 glycosylhydrolase [Foetidibacter luteolus]